MTYADTVRQIRTLRAQWRRSDDAYRADPFALTRRLNDTDGAAKRMRAVRAKEKK